MWNRNNRLHTSNKKHVHKEKKETTHVRVNERNIHHIYIYIKDKHNVCKNGHKTGVQVAKRSSCNNKEVNTPPNKMKHNSPLQRYVFLPLTCRILKRNYIFSPFLSWLTKGTRSYKTSPKKHKDDQRWSREHKKFM